MPLSNINKTTHSHSLTTRRPCSACWRFTSCSQGEGRASLKRDTCSPHNSTVPSAEVVCHVLVHMHCQMEVGVFCQGDFLLNRRRTLCIFTEVTQTQICERGLFVVCLQSSLISIPSRIAMVTTERSGVIKYLMPSGYLSPEVTLCGCKQTAQCGKFLLKTAANLRWLIDSEERRSRSIHHGALLWIPGSKTLFISAALCYECKAPWGIIWR